MIVIQFGRWVSKGTHKYLYERIYMTKPVFLWTPFCRRKKKTGVAINLDPPIEDQP